MAVRWKSARATERWRASEREFECDHTHSIGRNIVTDSNWSAFTTSPIIHNIVLCQRVREPHTYTHTWYELLAFFSVHIQQFHSVSIGWHSHYSVSNPLVNTTISYTILCYIAFYIIFVKIYCGHLLKLKLLSFSRTVRWNSFVRFSTAINEIFAHKLLAQVLSHTYFGPFSAATQHIIAYFHLVPGASFFLFGWMEWPQHLSWIWHWISVFSWHGFWNPENRPFKVDRNPPPVRYLKCHVFCWQKWIS